MVPLLLLITVAAFVLVQLVPGDPARVALGPKATPAEVAQLRSELGLERPLTTQYWEFVSNAASFDFGTSVRGKEDVGSLIERRVGPSFLLIGYALVVALLIALPLAVVAALRRGSWVDQTIRVSSTVAFVIPAFWSSLLLINAFSLQLGLLPSSNYGEGFAQHVESLTLPALVLALAIAPLLLRLLRSSLIETLQSEYIQAARARGLSARRVIVKHALRNSMTSTLTLLSFLFAALLSLSVVVEVIFSIPGLGSLLVSAVGARDFPVVQALALLFAVVVLLVSLLTDLAYAVLDPRVRL
jgi:peptide/nickel transport system permease protein